MSPEICILPGNRCSVEVVIAFKIPQKSKSLSGGVSCAQTDCCFLELLHQTPLFFSNADLRLQLASVLSGWGVFLAEQGGNNE